MGSDRMTYRSNDGVRAIQWKGDRLRLLDQRLLPNITSWVEATRAEQVADAIRNMVVRGAPAIGIAAAYGTVLAAREHADDAKRLEEALACLEAARPTAINLRWAINRQRRCIDQGSGDIVTDLLREARTLHEEDVTANYQMGALGSALIESGNVLTHCNTGSLATGGFGTALGVIRSAYEAGRISHIYADETRPWLQGARLTAWELKQDDIPVTLICEGAVSLLLARGNVKWIVVGADRIAANGDVANKIGTYGLAVLARYHGARFMVVAPVSTIDMDTSCGTDISIEERPGDEVLMLSGQSVAAEGVDAWNPVFDVTPASLIDVIVTEAGIIKRPDSERIGKLMENLV